jgi:short-subunit dehydrogenase
MKLSDAKGHWALVTGASSGIGREFAIQLARAGMHVVLVARRQERLEALALSLQQDFGVQTRVLAADLAEGGQVARLHATLASEGIKVRLLCNNAGSGRWGRFEQTAADEYQRMNALNTSAIVAMCHHFFADLASFPSSAVINVSSPANYQPVPFMAVYAASKAFVHSFSQALHGEWQEHGILVQTLVPGPTESEFDDLAGAYASALTGRGRPADIASASLAALARRAPVVAVAKGIFKQRAFAGLAPPAMVIREVAKMFKPPQ